MAEKTFPRGAAENTEKRKKLNPIKMGAEDFPEIAEFAYSKFLYSVYINQKTDRTYGFDLKIEGICLVRVSPFG